MGGNEDLERKFERLKCFSEIFGTLILDYFVKHSSVL